VSAAVGTYCRRGCGPAWTCVHCRGPIVTGDMMFKGRYGWMHSACAGKRGGSMTKRGARRRAA
jgi:hypothetical protein